MAEEVQNLMFEHLKRFQATLDRVERKQDESFARLANLENGQALIMQHLAHIEGNYATQQL